jgi:ribosomal-protein-alanine N-acetyltransferase
VNSTPPSQAVLTTARLLLRRPAPEDLMACLRIYGDPATNMHDPLGPVPDVATAATLLCGSMAHWDQHGFGSFVVTTRDAPHWVIGFAGVVWRAYTDVDVLNLGYRLEPAVWGKGYATELAAESLRHAFENLQLPVVFALVRPANAPSIRVLEKLGMRRSGTLDDVPGQAPSLLYRALPSTGRNPS